MTSGPGPGAGCRVVLDAQGRVVEFDAAAERLFGCTRQQALGRALVEIAASAQAREAHARAGAERERDAALAELESFTYAVSHDLRAPLRHIQSFAELLQAEIAGGRGDAQASHFTEVISGASARMARLIDALTAYSRAGRAPLRRVLVDMTKLVEEVREERCRAGGPQPGGRVVEWDIGTLPPVCGDRALLKQVWGNLIDNALKFSRAREQARIEIGSARTPDGIEFFVRDNGAGFDMKYADKLFGMFQRLHHADEFEGEGAGIAIAQRIVSRHGGTMRAEGEPGAGATFRFTLPEAE